MRLGVEKVDCEVLRAAGSWNSARESIADVGSVDPRPEAKGEPWPRVVWREGGLGLVGSWVKLEGP